MTLVINPGPRTIAGLTYRKRTATSAIILHDSHTDPLDSALAIERLTAKAYDLGLLSIGYHFVIDRDGTVIAGRPQDAWGAGTPGYGDEEIEVCLMGGAERFSKEPVNNFTLPQWQALRSLVAYLELTYGPLKVKGHSEMPKAKPHAAKCPAVSMLWVRRYLKGEDDVSNSPTHTQT